MIAYASNTGTKRNLAALSKAGWRILITPDGRAKPKDFPAFGIDNGAWSAHMNGTTFKEKPFLKLVERYGSYADWIIIPDIVSGGLKSLAFSVSWIDRLRDYRRLLLAVQDGMTREDVEPVLKENPRMGIFLGGSTEWKLATMYDWGLLACAARRWYHIGRVNTRRRIRLAAEAGADSFDGTSASRYSDTLPLLEAARQQPSLLVPSHMPWPM
jgi:hypothetical protein